MVATWCSRNDQLTSDEVRLLRRIYRDFAVSFVLPRDHDEKLCGEVGFTDVVSADWTEYVRATWKISGGHPPSP